MKWIILSICFFAVAISQPPPPPTGGPGTMPPPPNPFEFDDNKDGCLDINEWLAFTESMFDHMDANADGVIDCTEWVGPCAAFTAIAVGGQITDAQFQKGSKKLFNYMDKLSQELTCGGDGKICPQEYQIYGPPLPDPCGPAPGSPSCCASR